MSRPFVFLLAGALLISARTAHAQKLDALRTKLPHEFISSTNAAGPVNWAPKLEKNGVPNLHRVSDKLYRAAQPTAGGMRELERMGIKTVLSLRAFHSDREKIQATALHREQIVFNAWHPEHEDVVRFLKLVTDTNAAPVLVHCQHGADRTGMMIAIYRITVDNWSKDEAIAEMTRGHFGYHPMFGNLIRFIKRLDPESVRKEAGIASPQLIATTFTAGPEKLRLQ